MWSEETDISSKLYGNLEELQRTVAFIVVSRLVVWTWEWRWRRRSFNKKTITIWKNNHSSVLSYGNKHFAKINIDRLRSWLARPFKNPCAKLTPLTRPRHQRLADAKVVESVDCIAFAAFRVKSRICLYGTSRQDCLHYVNFDIL